jgi:hypothetical protein
MVVVVVVVVADVFVRWMNYDSFGNFGLLMLQREVKFPIDDWSMLCLFIMELASVVRVASFVIPFLGQIFSFSDCLGVIEQRDLGQIETDQILSFHKRIEPRV